MLCKCWDWSLVLFSWFPRVFLGTCAPGRCRWTWLRGLLSLWCVLLHPPEGWEGRAYKETGRPFVSTTLSVRVCWACRRARVHQEGNGGGWGVRRGPGGQHRVICWLLLPGIYLPLSGWWLKWRLGGGDHHMVLCIAVHSIVSFSYQSSYHSPISLRINPKYQTVWHFFPEVQPSDSFDEKYIDEPTAAPADEHVKETFF